MDAGKVVEIDSLSLPLVNRFYKSCRYSAKAGRGERVFVLRSDGQITAALRLSPKPDGFYFLRSMCVAPARRGQGFGSRLLQEILPELDRLDCYCFPFSHLQGFYAQVGFQLAAEASVADFIRDPFRRYRQQGRNIIIMCRRAGAGPEPGCDHV